MRARYPDSPCRSTKPSNAARPSQVPTRLSPTCRRPRQPSTPPRQRTSVMDRATRCPDIAWADPNHHPAHVLSSWRLTSPDAELLASDSAVVLWRRLIWASGFLGGSGQTMGQQKDALTMRAEQVGALRSNVTTSDQQPVTQLQQFPLPKLHPTSHLAPTTTWLQITSSARRPRRSFPVNL